MNNIPFATFLEQLQETNQPLDFFCDFEKINRNVEDIRLDLCMLNSLIGCTDMRQAVETIWRRDRSTFASLPMLLALRPGENKKYMEADGTCKSVRELTQSVDGVMHLLSESGLQQVLQEQKIKDTVDYVFGIETGLDTNARKNRSGHIMEQRVAQLLREYGITFETEVYSRTWPALSEALGTDEKRFDFVIPTPGCTYLAEVNFYSSGGSKLNELARAYTELSQRINEVAGFTFLWITDGKGWLSARNKLQEAYAAIPLVYNLTNIRDFLSSITA